MWLRKLVSGTICQGSESKIQFIIIPRSKLTLVCFFNKKKKPANSVLYKPTLKSNYGQFLFKLRLGSLILSKIEHHRHILCTKL